MAKTGGRSSRRRKASRREKTIHYLSLRLKWLLAAALVIVLIIFAIQQVKTARQNQANAGNMFVNEAVVKKLPVCDGSLIFSSPVVPVENSVRIVPLGSVDPSNGQIYPAESMSIQVKQQSDGLPTPTVVTAVLSPGNVHYIGARQTFYYKNGQVTRSDWAVAYTSCQQFVASNSHLAQLWGGLLADVNDSKKSCDSTVQTIAGQSVKRCTYHFDFAAKSGEQVGTFGGETNGPAGVDWSATDYRTARLRFINQNRQNDGSVADTYHAVCATNYYAPGKAGDYIQSQLPNRPEPRCGAAMQDLSGTIQGNWRLENSSSSQAKAAQQLAIVHSSADPSIGTLVIGGKAIASAGGLSFYPTQGGLINRDPSDVRQDGRIYCYQSDAPNDYSGSSLPGKVLVQLVTSKKLQVESQDGTCSGLDNFIQPTTYVR